MFLIYYSKLEKTSLLLPIIRAVFPTQKRPTEIRPFHVPFPALEKCMEAEVPSEIDNHTVSFRHIRHFHQDLRHRFSSFIRRRTRDVITWRDEYVKHDRPKSIMKISYKARNIATATENTRRLIHRALCPCLLFLAKRAILGPTLFAAVSGVGEVL